MSESLDRFGAFFVRHLRDAMLDDLEMFLRGGWKAPEVQELQSHLNALGERDKQTIRELFEHVTTAGMHDLLFALQEEADNGGDLRVLMKGDEVAKLTDGLHGELSGEEGWIVRYSRHHSRRQLELSRWAEATIQKVVRKKKE